MVGEFGKTKQAFGFFRLLIAKSPWVIRDSCWYNFAPLWSNKNVLPEGLVYRGDCRL